MTGITEVSVTDKESQELFYMEKYPIRAAKADDTLWFATRDMCAAVGYTEDALKIAAESPLIPDCCRSYGYELPDPAIPGQPDGAVLLLSPVGVWYWTHATDAPRGQSLAAWAKRETARLVPEARKDDPATFLTLGPNLEMPPYPMKYSGRKGEWIALKDRRYDLKNTELMSWPYSKAAAVPLSP